MLLEAFSFDYCSSEAFRQCFDEAFDFSIRSRPGWGYLAMMKTVILDEVGEFLVWNGGPLSLFSCVMLPIEENMRSRTGMTAQADVLYITSAKQNRLWSSIRHNRYSPLENGPQKSMDRFCHGPGGN